MKTLMIGALLTLSFTSLGQRNEKCCISEPITVEAPSLPTIENYDGTFQFQLSANDGFNYTSALIDRIYAERKANEDVVLDLGNGRSVLILSEETIESAGFVAYTTPYNFK